MPYTLGIYTLGCKVNQYESEAIAEYAEKTGFVISEPSDICDVYIINTCTVTAESDRKSRQFIRRALSENPNAIIIATGCFSQVSPEKVAEIKGVDYVCGSRNKLETVDAAMSLVGKQKPEKAKINLPSLDARGFEPMQISKFPRTRAYIKIEDGCESHCTYCIIPRARGKICSKEPDAVLSEIQRLADIGCKEVVLTGIETASYGIDLDGYRLGDLLCDADKIASGQMRIRLGSLDPSLIKPRFVDKISNLKSIAPHFHLSMQSGCDKILALMKRKYNTKMALDGISLLRNAFPDVQLTTDIITAFPGETDADFNETVEFCKKVGFLNAHIFTYSKREGTPAAKMTGQVRPDIAHSRTSHLISVQKEITNSILKSQTGKTFDVLFETNGDGYSVGHTPSFIETKVMTDKKLQTLTERVLIEDVKDGIAIGKIV